ncbi:hypothetical protein [Nocardia concava]|uniref:hypothetical protein n=1 Tax=Nocardia concava TaxID=257281 RepID=UPI0002E82CC8|nr:hypothetical protein [Nocardia concava]
MTIELDKTTDESTAPTESRKPAAGRAVSVPVRTLAWSAAVAVPTVTALVLGVQLVSARDDLSAREATAADNAHAEQVASDYAVGASTVNFADFDSWVARLKKNTAPALSTKFESTAPKLQDLLTPLKWTSTGSPISAKVVSESAGVYKVNVFVNVSSTNAQNPDGARTTVTYNVTVDSNADWKISDVGGLDGALPLK